MDVILAAEDFGLPPESTADDLKSALRTMREENVKMKTVIAAQAKAIEDSKGAQERAVRLTAEMAVDKAIAFQSIDKFEREDWIEDYLANPTRTQRRIDARATAGLLKRAELGLRDESAVPDAAEELTTVVAKIRESNKEMSESDAVKKAYRDNPGLFDRVTEARRTVAATKEGGR